MKHLILILSAVLTLSISVTAQETDSTYTTFTSEVVQGYEGTDTCVHEWFTTTTDITVTDKRTQTTSRQCVKCGKQNSTVNIWTTYLKEEEENEE